MKKREPCMLWENLTLSPDEYESVKQSAPGSLYAYLFPFSVAEGCIFRIHSRDKPEYFDLRVTRSYQNMVDPDKYSIELERT